MAPPLAAMDVDEEYDVVNTGDTTVGLEDQTISLPNLHHRSSGINGHESQVSVANTARKATSAPHPHLLFR